VQVESPLADPTELLRVHPEAYVERLRASVERAALTRARVEFAPETVVSDASWEAILGSLGGVLEACDAVLAGRWRNAFVATRPPGHHCGPSRAMGFCPVNVVAVAARRLIEEAAAERVLIVDWDVHHGNGTQDVFWTDPDVYYQSLHQAPWYPGTGRATERGEGPGAGRTLNVPLPAGTDGATFRSTLRGALRTVVAEHPPDFVPVSSGFDGLATDPLGGFLLKPYDFHAAARILMEVAGPTCEGRIVALLEGGYDPEPTGLAVADVLRAFAGLDPAGSTLPPVAG